MIPVPRYWIAVASANHVQRGIAGGFMQVNHGKAPPLKRIRPGDRIIYYSPSEEMRVTDGLQSFTAIGTVKKGEPYQGEMGGGFTPFRRDVEWLDCRTAPIRPLLDQLELTAGRRNWGQALRYGLLEISGVDFSLIEQSMIG